jgi:membrane protein YdbS with pleckstrin-like domain
MSQPKRNQKASETETKSTEVLKSVPNAELKSNGKIIVGMGVFVFAIGLIPLIMFNKYIEITIGVLTFFSCFFYFLFYFGGRYIFSYVIIHPDSITLRHGFFFWHKTTLPLSDIVDVGITSSPSYQVYYLAEREESAGSNTITIYFKSRPPYKKTSAYIANYEEISAKIIELTKIDPKKKEKYTILHLHGNHKNHDRCTKCGIMLYDDWFDADECPNCRILSLCKRAMLCFVFSAIPIILLFAVLSVGRDSFFELLSVQQGMTDAYGYAVFMYIYLNTATGFCTYIGLGSLVATYSIIDEFKSKRKGGELAELTPDEMSYVQSSINPRFVQKRLIMSFIIGMIFLLFKTIYIIQVILSNFNVTLIILIVELVVDGLVYYMVVGISRFQSVLRGGIEKKYWIVIAYGNLVILILSFISMIVQLIMTFS